jgi:hypothetical protein
VIYSDPLHAYHSFNFQDIDSVESLASLKTCPRLRLLNLRGNPVAEKASEIKDMLGEVNILL